MIYVDDVDAAAAALNLRPAESGANVILVGAQAVYMRAGDADLAVPPYTTDGDLALDPAVLAESSPIELALRHAGFLPRSSDSVGSWVTDRLCDVGVKTEVVIDLLVPASVSPGKGWRAVRLPEHDPKFGRTVADSVCS